MVKKYTLGIFVFILLVLFTRADPPIIDTLPYIPTEFYGTATIYDTARTAIPAGSTVTVYAGNVSCGAFTISNSGYYGALSCIGDDNYTVTDEGILLKKVQEKPIDENDPIIQELSEKSDKINLKKSNLGKTIDSYKKTKQGGLDLIWDLLKE